jgi:hypothetical protein
MALTTLDPNTALIVIDLQKGIAGYKGPRAGFSFTKGVPTSRLSSISNQTISS